MPPKNNVNHRNGGPNTTFTVRPFPQPVSHKTFLRVNLHRAAIAAHTLKSGELCHISVYNEDGRDGEEDNVKYPVVAWLAADPHMQKHIALISETVRGLLGIGFEHKVTLGKYGGVVRDATTVIVVEVEVEEVVQLPGKNVTAVRKLEIETMEPGEKEGWKWFLEHIFVESKYVYEGLAFTSVEYKGKKRAFKILKVHSKNSNSENGIASSTIPAYKMSETTTIEFSTSTPAPTLTTLPIGSAAPSPIPQKGISKTPASPESTTALVKSSKTTFSSIGGLSTQIGTLKTLLHSTLHHSHHFSRFNLTPPRGILLYGPPGTGKTLLLKAVASEINAQCFVISGSVVGKYMGESEAAVRKVFADARKNQPAIVFIDEIDSLAPKRGAGDGGEGRVVSTLLTEMDGVGISGEDGGRVVVVAATNRVNAIDEALRRPGRFDREIEIGIPDVNARREILQLLTKDIPFLESAGTDKEAFVKAIAGRTHGFVGADLEALVRGGFTIALKRIGDGDGAELVLREEDVEEALKDVRPTAMREIFLEPQKVRWSDIGGQEEVKQRLREAVEWPLTHPEAFSRLGGTPRKGLLLYGPPGCSKTLTAKALATEAGLNFMAVKGPELFSMYVGESERAVREVFRKARAASPSIIFFDEIDALSATREGTRGGGVGVLTALLNEMDGIEGLRGVTVLAATNRPEIIDPALMRPGRLDTILYVGPPDFEARREILKIKMKNMSVSEDVDIEDLATRTDGYSGAEIVNICDEAIHFAMRESFEIDAVGKRHFEAALEKAVPQITQEMRESYEQWSVGGVKKI
ncbi:AAA+-type ATPase [Rhizina undulata]